MARATYVPVELGREVEAPAGHYIPQEEGFLACAARRVLYIAGGACIDASCCGTSSWSYVRVEGFVDDEGYARHAARHTPGAASIEIDTVDDPEDRKALSDLLAAKYPAARIEFR